VQRIFQDTAYTQEGDDEKISDLVDRWANNYAQKIERFRTKDTKNDKQLEVENPS